MSMYETFKNQFAVSLSGRFEADEIAYIISKLNVVAIDYEVSAKSKELIQYDPNTIPSLVKTFLVCRKIEGLADGTLYNYSRYLTLFFQYVCKNPDDVTPNDVRVFLFKYQEAKGITNRSLDKIRNYLSSFYNWAFTENYVKQDPTKAIKAIKFTVKPREALTQIELEYLRKACNSARERAIIEFLYSTGCRISELAGVKLSDINWEKKTVSLLGKGQKYRISYINAKAEIAMKDYLDTRNDTTDFLFVSERSPHSQMHRAGLEKIVKEVAARANLNKKITPHILRHTTATIALNNGMPVEDISKLLGHANISTTMIYAKASAEKVRDGHNKCVI